jgi:hypothetical protein
MSSGIAIIAVLETILARFNRKSKRFSKSSEILEAILFLFFYYNFREVICEKLG